MKARTNLIATIAVGAALFVPVAHAQSPDDQAGLRGPGGIAAQQAQTGAFSHPDNRDVRGSAVANTATQLAVRPDDRAGVRGPGAMGSVTVAGAVGHPDNRTEPRGPGAVDTVVVRSAPSGFDWGDALIGGLGGLGTALLLTGGVILLTSQRNRARLA
jgi:hypothetical protein